MYPFPGISCLPRKPLAMDATFDLQWTAFGSSESRSVFFLSSDKIGCVSNVTDPEFGSFIRFTPDGSEVLITGQRVYVVNMNAIFPYFVPSVNDSSINPSICVDVSKLQPSFYPNRFAYAGEDWDLLAGDTCASFPPFTED